jgi:hypothetical protein
VFPRKLLIAGLLAASVFCAEQISAQQSSAQLSSSQPGAEQQNSSQPKVKVNVLNVCTPSVDDQKELTSALGKIPAKPAFGADYEISRGHSILDPNTPIPGMEQIAGGAAAAATASAASADWVRIRREFPSANLFSNVQYSFSVDSANMVETLVLRVRDPKDVMEISIEDSASAVTTAAAMLSTSTPVSRIRLERFGKSSIALARCPGTADSPAPDQSMFEPIFRSASATMERYRGVLGARRMIPQELARLGPASGKKSSGKSGAGKPPAAKSANGADAKSEEKNTP